MKTESIIEAKPPYVSYRTFKNTIESLRQSGLPNRIDRSIFPGMSGAAQSFLLASMRFLGLIDKDGLPTSSLKDLVDNPATEKAALTKITKDKYHFIFNGKFNFNSATDAQLTEEFKGQGLNGSTIVKAISFLTSICESAGIPISPHLKSKRGATAGATVRRQYKKRKAQDDSQNETDREAPKQNESIQAQLLAKFPNFDPKWDAEMQKKWFESFEKFMNAAKKAEGGT